MGNFTGKDTWKIYLDKQTKQKVKDLADYLENNFEGPSDYVQTKLQEEDTLSDREKYEKFKQKRDEFEEKAQQMKQVIQDREKQDKLRDKKELLKQKQSKLEEVRDTGFKSREEIREEEFAKRENSNHDFSEEEMKEAVDRAVERKLDKRLDVDELVEEVQRLQNQISELQNEDEEWFMDLQPVKQEVTQ